MPQNLVKAQPVGFGGMAWAWSLVFLLGSGRRVWALLAVAGMGPWVCLAVLGYRGGAGAGPAELLVGEVPVDGWH